MAVSWIFGLVFASTILQELLCRPEQTSDEGFQPCNRPDYYCRGESFSDKIPFKNRLVTCDNVVNPRQKCCLPQAKHKVCYDILVDGNRLNFNPASQKDDTNFSALCTALLERIGERPGHYVTAYTDSGNGTLRYNFDSFDLASASGTFIRHLACSIEE